MCLPLCPCLYCFELISFLPLLLAFLMPIYGSLFGVSSVLRMSLILFFYAICNFFLSKQLGVLGPCMSGLALAMVSTVQFIVIPSQLLWLYELCFWIIEPVLQIIEVVMVVSLTMKASAWVMEMNDSHPPLGKVFVLTFSMTSYTIIPFLLWISALQVENLFWLVYVVATMYLVTAMATICKEEGVISDAAMVSLASAVALVIAQWERNCAESITELGLPPEEIRTDEKSLLEMILSMPTVSLGYANRPIELFRKIFSLPFWFIAALRIFSAIWLVVQLRHRNQEDDASSFFGSDSSDEEDRPYFGKNASSQAFRSSIAVILVAIFVYTQIVVVHLGHTDSSPTVSANPLTSGLKLFPDGASRFLQSFGIVGWYLFKLGDCSRNEDDDW